MILKFIQNLFEFKADVYIVYCSLIYSAALAASLSASKLGTAHYMMQSGYITSMEDIQLVSLWYTLGLCILYIALALVIILRCVGPMQDLWFQSSQVPRPTTGPGSLTSPRVVIMRLKQKKILSSNIPNSRATIQNMAHKQCFRREIAFCQTENM